MQHVGLEQRRGMEQHALRAAQRSRGCCRAGRAPCRACARASVCWPGGSRSSRTGPRWASGASRRRPTPSSCPSRTAAAPWRRRTRRCRQQPPGGRTRRSAAQSRGGGSLHAVGALHMLRRRQRTTLSGSASRRPRNDSTWRGAISSCCTCRGDRSGRGQDRARRSRQQAAHGSAQQVSGRSCRHTCVSCALAAVR